MSRIKTTNLERENLEAHVDLCAERYSYLESRLTAIENKVDGISKDVQSHIKTIHDEIRDSDHFMSKIIVGSAITIVLAIFSAVIAIYVK